MPSPLVSKRDRWLALGLLALLLALAYVLLVHSLWTKPLLEANERLAQLQQRDARMRAVLKQAPQVSERLQQVRMQLAQGNPPGFMAEPTRELATAALAQKLEAAVAQASPGNRSCAINNRSPLEAPSKQEAYPRVTLQVRLRCGDPELAAALHSLESGTPRLFVENLVIFSQNYEMSGGQNNGLDVSFDLYGYLLAPAAQAQEQADGTG